MTCGLSIDPCEAAGRLGLRAINPPAPSLFGELSEGLGLGRPRLACFGMRMVSLTEAKGVAQNETMEQPFLQGKISLAYRY